MISSDQSVDGCGYLRIYNGKEKRRESCAGGRGDIIMAPTGFEARELSLPTERPARHAFLSFSLTLIFFLKKNIYENISCPQPILDGPN